MSYIILIFPLVWKFSHGIFYQCVLFNVEIYYFLKINFVIYGIDLTCDCTRSFIWYYRICGCIHFIDTLRLFAIHSAHNIPKSMAIMKWKIHRQVVGWPPPIQLISHIFTLLFRLHVCCCYGFVYIKSTKAVNRLWQ